MKELILGEPFFNLPNPGLVEKFNSEGTIDDFVLDTELFESEIGRRNGHLDIGKIGVGQLSEEELAHYQRIIPYHHGNHPIKLISSLIPKAEQFPNPIAKIVANLEELERDILKIYQTAYAHYVIAKNSSRYEDFPRLWCGNSSMGLQGTLMLHGFLNATTAISFIYDHTYVMLPFVMINPRINGVILVDPTSDQLGKIQGKAYRNFVAIKRGTEWKYITEWEGGGNLFPSRISYLGNLSQKGAIMSDGKLKSYSFYFRDGDIFLETAFSNPVKFPTD